MWSENPPSSSGMRRKMLKLVVEQVKSVEARVTTLKQELAALKTNPLVEIRQMVVDQYQESEDFKLTKAESLFPEQKSGWNYCLRFLIEGGIHIPEGFSLQEFWAKHLEGYSSDEEDDDKPLKGSRKGNQAEEPIDVDKQPQGFYFGLLLICNP